MVLIRGLGAFLAVISFAVLLESPKRLIPYAGITGMAGWIGFLFAQMYIDSIVVVAFLSAVIIAVLSHIFARVLKSAVSVFFVAGILPIVPGGSIYRSVYYLIHNEQSLSDFYFAETLQIAGSIALAIFFDRYCFSDELENKGGQADRMSNF